MMTLNECYQKYHSMIVWTAAMTVAEFPEMSVNDLVHSGYIHIARYIDTNLDDQYKESSTVFNLARWGMLKEALKENKWKKRHQSVGNYSGYSAVPRDRYIPASERIKRSRVCCRDPLKSIMADEIIENLCHEERMILLGISVYGITAQEIADENGTNNEEVLAAYHDVIKKIRWRLAKPNIKKRKSRAAWHRWFHNNSNKNTEIVNNAIT